MEKSFIKHPTDKKKSCIGDTDSETGWGLFDQTAGEARKGVQNKNVIKVEGRKADH